ncbi:hypothetical protein DXG01_003399 [Tephrocybe rancida]|nr:hypothetical protein DXG01_003399 [Tephrocybe rancida]
MTDYASQGKTRPKNPADLSKCLSHQSYYTVLSCCASASGTLILTGYDKTKITGKASGALRQEFRELELLDEITRLRYLRKLPPGMHDSERRNTLISTFRSLKSPLYQPSQMHPALKWSENDPFDEDSVEYLAWGIVDKDNLQKLPAHPSTFVPAKGASPPDVAGTKRKNRFTKDDEEHQSKCTKSGESAPEGTTLLASPATGNSILERPLPVVPPTGLLWFDNSCAYDAVLTIIHRIWADTSVYVTCLESSREQLRTTLFASQPEYFPRGGYTSVHTLLEWLLKVPYNVCESRLLCVQGCILFVGILACAPTIAST